MINATNPNQILIINDNLSDVETISNVLKEAGYHILSVDSINNALKKLRLVSPSLILLDAKFFQPNVDRNWPLVQQYFLERELPIITIAEHLDRHHLINHFGFTFFDRINKPFQQEEILYKVHFNLNLYLIMLKVRQQNDLLRSEIKTCQNIQYQLSERTKKLETHLMERETKISLLMEEVQKNKTKLLAYEETIKTTHFSDSLTGLPNRTWLLDRLKTIVKLKEKNPDFQYAVLSIGLDRFKIVNDCFGHLFGDELLKKAAIRLQNNLTDRGTLTRFGGDEFMILLDKIKSLEEAIFVARSIQEQFKIPFHLNGYEIFSGVSIGIAFSTMEYHSPIDILRDAGIAMSQAKQAGKGRYEVLTAERRTQAIARLQLENDLRQAIEREEFYLEYQPIYALSTGEIQGFEALVRWQHPLQGRVPPSDFIPTAEEIGSIDRLGYWVLKEATRQLKVWHQMFPQFSALVMNVNLSAKQLKQINLLDEIESIFSEAELPGNSLKLEITESCFLEISNREIQILEHLQDMGIGLCIDDFGTGYSSLSRLHKFPMDTIKVDRSFVMRLSRGSRETEIMQTIGNLARNLGLNLVAEGIETTEQLHELQELGYQFGQGYLFSKPLNSKMATELLNRF